MSVKIFNDSNSEIEVTRFADNVRIVIKYDKDEQLEFIFDTMYDVEFFLSRITGCMKSIKEGGRK